MNGSSCHRPGPKGGQAGTPGPTRVGVAPPSMPPRRRGVVLVIVVGILAVMMLMAGTLALLSRVGHQMSVSYDYSQALDGLSDAVEAYAMDTLHRDKYGTDGLPYSYELGYWDPLNLGLAYPTDGSRNGDDEGFDSHLNEEWLPNPDYALGTPDAAWRAFQGRPYLSDPSPPYDPNSWESGNFGVRVDLDGGGAYDWMVAWHPYADLRPTSAGRAGLTGTDATARVSLYYEDLGGARIDVNAAGNANNRQNQGLTPFEVDLSVVAGAAAGPLITGRENGGAGAANWLPGANRLDQDADGTVADGGDYTIYSPIYPDPATTYAPFDNFDLNDLFQMTNTGSRVAAILTAAGIGTNDYYLFTTQSAGTSFAARPTATTTSFSVGADTMLNSPFFSRGSGNALPSKRPLSEIVTQLSPRELADFLESLDPLVTANNDDLSITAPADRRRILRQTATNLKDMVDPDNVVSVWRDEGADGIAGTGDDDTYCGVEVTPYVAEGEVAVPTWYLPWAPGPVRETLPDYLSQQVVSPTPPSPPLPHPGKYIKLVNPWNVDIPLCDASGNALFRLVLPHEYPAGSNVPRLRQWVRVPSADGEHSTLFSIPWPTDVVIDWEERAEPDDFVPARGNYIIVEDEATLRLLLGLGTGDPILLPLENYTIESDLQYMQECIGRPIPTEDSYKWLQYMSAIGALDPGTVLTGETSGDTGTVVLHDSGRSLLLLSDMSTTEHFLAGENLLGPNPPPDIRAQASGVAEPIYDWFENPPDTPLALQPSVDAWIALSVPPAVESSVGGSPGMPSAIELFQVDADSPLMFTVLPDTTVTGPASYDDEDDWPLVTTTLSGQMDDPRPCWVRWNEASGFESAQATGNNPGPWGRNAWDRLSKQTAGTWSSLSTADATLPASWFNTNWAWTLARHDASRGINTGDGWNVLYDPSGVPPTPLEDDVRYSFPPVRENPEDGMSALGVPEYTNVPGHETAVMNLGLLSSPGDIGFVHAGMPWTTVSLGDYGQEDLVYLREFLDYIAAPISPYESRGAHAGYSEFRLGRGARVGNGAMHSVAGDFDGDGFLDVAVAAAADNMVNVLYGGPGGVLGGRLDYSVGASPQGIVTADFDLDGRLDLAVVNDSDQDVSVLYGQVGGGFGGRLDLPIGNNAEGIVAADLNGDGRPDLAAVNRSDGTLSVLYSLGAGAFTPQSIYLIGSGHFWPVAGDFNGDGRLDLATAGDSTLTVYYQLSGGGFGGRQDYVVGPGPGPGITDIATADFSRDGRLDFALANEGNGYVTLIYGQVGGGFGGAWNSPPVSFPMRLSLGDFNGDGLTDVAAGCPGNNSVTLLFCATDGTLTAGRRDYIFGTPSNDMAVGDFNADGALDLALPFDVLDEVAVLTNLSAAARICGRVNVNTAPAEVLQAAMKQAIAPPPLLPGEMAAMAAGWIVGDRAAYGPYTSVDDLLNRMVALVPPGPNVWGFRQEAFARFMTNLVTVRTDVWGVRGRVQLFRDNGIDPATGLPIPGAQAGQWDAGEEILSERQFYMVVDRSQKPIRVLLKRYLAE